MKLLALASALSLGLAISGVSTPMAHADSQPTLSLTQAQTKLNAILEDVWQYELSQFPSLARSKGVKTDLAFTDISPKALAARNTKFKEFLAQLDNIDLQALPNSERISLLMQQYRLNNYVSQYEFNEYRVPITSEYGFHNSIANVPNAVNILDQSSFEQYIKPCKPSLSSLNNK